MVEMKKARLVHHEGTVTVVLPEDFGLAGDEVYVTRDAETGDVTLSRQPQENAWQAVFDEMDAYQVSDEDWRIFEEALSEARGRPLFGDH